MSFGIGNQVTHRALRPVKSRSTPTFTSIRIEAGIDGAGRRRIGFAIGAQGHDRELVLEGMDGLLVCLFAPGHVGDAVSSLKSPTSRCGKGKISPAAVTAW